MSDIATRSGWLSRLKAGLTRSSSKLGEGIAGIFRGRRLDQEALEELEELLIGADLGVGPAARLTTALGRRKFEEDAGDAAIRSALAEEVAKILEPVARPLALDSKNKPSVVLVVGVNGSGKTTTIGKLAKLYAEQGLKLRLAAGDTFRAAAIEQLKIWAERAGVAITAKAQGADPAGLAYEALEAARAEGADLLLIDTAGRLHNKANLMAELEKIIRVLRKLEPSAPHEVLLVLDATTGQNALSQVATFKELVQVSGLVVTKLDGSARGGVLVALAEKFAIPVRAIGVGEGAEHLRPFKAEDFARSLLGL